MEGLNEAAGVAKALELRVLLADGAVNGSVMVTRRRMTASARPSSSAGGSSWRCSGGWTAA